MDASGQMNVLLSVQHLQKMYYLVIGMSHVQQMTWEGPLGVPVKGLPTDNVLQMKRTR